MNDLKVFSNTEFGELGVMVIDGKEYFPATQCAKLLGYKNPQEAVREKCKGVRKMLTPTAGGSQEANYIPEGDLYRLIVSSKLPSAEKFERWVFDEVLPSIRKTGGYGDIDIREVIAQTAAAVVNEVVKQLVPVITKAVCNEPVTAQEDDDAPGIPRRNFTVEHSLVGKLEPELRAEIDGMLLSRYTYREITEYLSSMGISIGKTSLSRRYKVLVNRMLERSNLNEG